MKIVHLITSLNIGGAERMLERLLKEGVDTRNTLIISLSEKGEISKNLEDLGYRVFKIKLKKNFFSVLKGVFVLRRFFLTFRPDIIQTWLYHSNILGSIAASFLKIPVVWNLRGTSIPQGFFSITNLIVGLSSFLSYSMPNKIICCGESVKKAHKKLGFSKSKMVVLPNGYDFKNFKRNKQARCNIRKSYDISESNILIGSVGRFDLLKDHKNFIQACSLIRKRNKNIKFMIIGRDINIKNDALMSILIRHNMETDIILVDEQKDLNSFYSAMDIFCLHSFSEGFPNVLVEAMANSLPCVSTNAGEAGIILNDPEFTVRVNNPTELSEKLLCMIELSTDKRKQLGLNNSNKVKKKYDIRKIKRIYFDLYNQLLKC